MNLTDDEKDTLIEMLKSSASNLQKFISSRNNTVVTTQLELQKLKYERIIKKLGTV